MGGDSNRHSGGGGNGTPDDDRPHPRDEADGRAEGLACRLGAPRELLNRLVAIQCTDLLLGAVPVFGDLVDAGYRANQRSADLVHEWLESRQSEPQ